MTQVTIERRGAVAILTLTNPPDGYMDSVTVPELDAATFELENDRAVRAIIVTGGLLLAALATQLPLRRAVHHIDIARIVRERSI